MWNRVLCVSFTCLTAPKRLAFDELLSNTSISVLCHSDMSLIPRVMSVNVAHRHKQAQF